MDTNAVITVLAEPFGLDDRRDIFGEVVLQEVRQNFFARAIRVRGLPMSILRLRRACSRRDVLHVNEPAFAMHTPTVTGDRAIRFYHAMARYRHCEAVGRADRADLLCGGRHRKCFGKRAVGPGLTRRDCPQCRPYCTLQLRATEIEWKVETTAVFIDERNDFCDCYGKIAVILDQLSIRKAVAEITPKFLPIVTKENRGNTAITQRYQNEAEFCLTVSEA
jgi:hypothetical protein